MVLRYRRLTREELGYLEKEFIEFLIINGIAADDWVGLKEQDIEKAEQLIDLFSNFVFEKILSETVFLEHRTDQSIYCFFYQKERILLAGIELPSPINGDLWDNAYIDPLISNPPAHIEVIQSEKEYTKERPDEIFEMIKKGARITDGQLFKKITLAALK